MSLLLRIIEVIVPVFFTVALGYLYARRHKPDMKTFNQIALDVCVPLLTYSALASSSFHLQEHSVLLQQQVAPHPPHVQHTPVLTCCFSLSKAA
jgi:hypothetical protein